MFSFSEFTQFNPWLTALALNSFLLGVAWVIPKKLLTPSGYLHAWALGVILWATGGLTAYTVVMVYFFLGSVVTRLGMKRKEEAGIAEKRSGQRGPENVWGSALIASFCALGTLWLSPAIHPLLWLGYTASFSTKLSDTTASEVGKAYGKHTFLLTSLQAVPPGTEGAISLEGTLAGFAASIVIAVLGYLVGLITPLGIIWCIVAALIATTIESLIGATIQPKFTWLTNELVNVINTLIGAIVAITLGVLVSL